MAKNNDFRGDVGQVIMGDVNQGPAAFSNVMHVNLANQNFEVKPLTHIQRNKIKEKVRDVVVATGRLQLDIYRDILSEFGAKDMDSFDGCKYKLAMDYLEHLIDVSQPDSSSPQLHENCMYCEKTQKALRFSQYVNFVVLGISICLFACMMWSMHARPTVISEVDQTCQHDGKIYSIGSIVRMHDNSFRQCFDAQGSAPSYWDAIEHTKTKMRSK